MLAWFNSHNAQITENGYRFGQKKIPMLMHKSLNLNLSITILQIMKMDSLNRLAKTWLNKKGDLSRLASRLTKWLLFFGC